MWVCITDTIYNPWYSAGFAFRILLWYSILNPVDTLSSEPTICTIYIVYIPLLYRYKNLQLHSPGIWLLFRRCQNSGHGWVRTWVACRLHVHYTCSDIVYYNTVHIMWSLHVCMFTMSYSSDGRSLCTMHWAVQGILMLILIAWTSLLMHQITFQSLVNCSRTQVESTYIVLIPMHACIHAGIFVLNLKHIIYTHIPLHI